MIDNLERELRAIYGAYEYLRAHDLTAVSTTSRLLHEGNLTYLAGRVRDELAELRGAVAGTHGHGGGRDDIVLEAYQATYWLIVLAVAAGERYDDVAPHLALSQGSLPDRDEQGDWPGLPQGATPTRRREALRQGFAVVGRLCRAAGVSVDEAVRRDTAELRARPYLTPYWAARDAHRG